MKPRRQRDRTVEDYAYVTEPPYFLRANKELWQAWAYVQAGGRGRSVASTGWRVWAEATELGEKMVLEIDFERTR